MPFFERPTDLVGKGCTEVDYPEKVCQTGAPMAFGVAGRAAGTFEIVTVTEKVCFNGQHRGRLVSWKG